MQPAWTSLFWFLAVLAMIPLVLWMLKKSSLLTGLPLGACGAGPGATPRAVAQLALSPQHKLVTVEVGEGDERLWLVLGVSPQGLQTLHTMSAGVAAPAVRAAAPATTFAQLLQRIRRPGAADDGR